jgi:hypothetical protein
MATLTTQTIVRTGLAPSYAAAAGGGDAMDTGDDMVLHVKNTSGGAITVTFAIGAAQSTVAGVAYTNTAVSVPATTGDRMIGPISSIYKDATTGLATITYSGVTNLTVAAIKLQP